MLGWDSGGSCFCSDNGGYIGDYLMGACFSSVGGGQGGVCGCCVFICGNLIKKSKKFESVWNVPFALFVPGGLMMVVLVFVTFLDMWDKLQLF